MKNRLNFVFNIFILCTLLISSMGSSLGVVPAYATGSTFTVNDTSDAVDIDPGNGICEIALSTGNCTLRAAIQEANALAGADTITLPAGTYTLTILGAGEDLSAVGDLDITGDLIINGAGANIVTIQSGGTPGSGIDRVFHIPAAVTVNISGVTIANGKCQGCSGGGIANDSGGILTVSDSVFSSNSATTGGAGGGIYNLGSTLSVNSSTFSDNSAPNGTGGGISNGSGGTLTVINSTFSANVAGSVGGGLENSGVAATVTNDTFSDNTAGSNGGAVWNYAVLHLVNTILANNTSSNDCYNQSGGTLATDSNNLIMNNAASINMCGVPAITAAPNLGALTNNGGTTPTFALLPGSPAIDAGNDGVCPAADQRGVGRPSGAHCDIGAYESTADTILPTVTTFTTPTTSLSLNILITSFTASDNVGVAGYMITESSTPPAPTDSGWSGTVPAIYTAPCSGTYTLYPWVKDAADNVSAVFASPVIVIVNVTGSVLLLDDFNSGTAINDNLATRQSGTRVTQTYSLGTLATCNLLSGYASCTEGVSLDYNFNSITSDSTGGIHVSAQMNLDPNSISPIQGVCFNLGSTAANRFNAPTDTNGPFQACFSADGRFFAYNNSGSLTPIVNWASIGNYSNTWHQFDVYVRDLSDGDPFNGSGDTEFFVFADGNFVYTFDVLSGLPGNFVGLYSYGFNYIDNLTISQGDSLPCLSAVKVVTGGDSGQGTLRQALVDACPSATITFAPALAGATIHLASPLILAKDVTIDGSGLTSQVTLSGDADNNGTSDVRVLEVSSGVSAVLGNLTITRGNAGSGDGGAISNDGSLTIMGSTISHSFAGYGGGIYNIGTLNVINSTISNNDSTNYGGGIKNLATLTVTNSTFANNHSAAGGGILNEATLAVLNSTFSGNSADTGGGIANLGGTLDFKNTIIANSLAGGDCVNGASIGININNLVEDGSCSAMLSGDPNLGALANNGGPTQTFAITTASPAFNAGDNSSCTASDQRGITRPQNGVCDIGAYELKTFVVNSNVDALDANTADGICETTTAGECTLRAAIQQANADAGADTIIVPSDVYTLTIPVSGEDASATGDLDITDDLTITGAGAKTTIIRAGLPGAGIDRVFHIPGGANVNISGVTIANGKCSVCNGGGIDNEGGILSVTKSMFAGNSTDSATFGGGIYNGGSLIVAATTFYNNSSDIGGGIYSAAGGSLTIVNTTFASNSAGNIGGGLYNLSPVAIIVNSTFSGNSASANGGAIWNNSGSALSLKNTILANSLTSDDCYNQDGSPLSADINNLIMNNAVGPNQCGTPAVTTDPLLGALADNGGTTLTFAITSSSLAYNAGDLTVCPAFDQRGIPRPQMGGCDIGAYEASPNMFFVTNTNNAGSGSLRQAISEANGTLNDPLGPDQIHFKVAGTIASIAPLPAITEPVKIDGGNNVTLDGANAGPGANGLMLDTSDSVVSRLTITNFSSAGVVVVNKSVNINNRIVQNSIYNNAALDLDLGGDGLTLNHDGTIAGPNAYQNYPLLELATSDGSSTLRLMGTLESASNSSYTIDVYANPTCHSNYFGGGKNYLGTLPFPVTTDVSGIAKFDQTLAVGVPETYGITLTATGSFGTSEFSYCKPVSTENLNWVQAQDVNGVPSTQQYITDNFVEKWFKFTVHPDDTVHIKLSGLEGSVLTLHTDPNTIYDSLINPTDEAALSAQSADSAFLSTGFLPSRSLPSESSSAGFLPSRSLPSRSLPSRSLPFSSLPSRSLPSRSLPSGALPDGSLPSGSSEAQSLPSRSLPSRSLTSQSPDAYASAALQSLIAISMNPYADTQVIDHNTYDYDGDLYVRVVGSYNLQSPFTLEVTIDNGVCSMVSPIANSYQVVNGVAPANSYKTLILTDSSRLSGTAAEISTAMSKLNALAARSDVVGAVIDLSDAKFERVAQANVQADANLACPSAKNIVADEIKNVIDAYRAANSSTLQYIVLAGGAHVIPYFQVPDMAGLAPEKDYVVPVAPSTASEAGLMNNLVQGQDGYGSQTEITQGGYKLDYPDLAVGRLVDSASDITAEVNAYIAVNGVVTPHSSLVTGYDFVGDAAIAIKDEVDAGTASTADTLIQYPPAYPTVWTANDLRTKLLAGGHDVVVLTGHFSAGTLLAADYATQMSAEEIQYSSVNLNGVLFLTLGCHGGYTVPTTDMLPVATPDPDWAKAFLRKGAAGYIAATGYAYGDTELTEYGERLFLLVSQQLRTGTEPVPVGFAMMEAKRKYLADTAQMTGIDHKTIVEMSLYGFPMLKVNMPGTRLTPSTDTPLVSGATTVPDGPGAALGLGAAPASLSPSVTPKTKSLENLSTNTTITATYLTGADGVIANPFEPILPKEIHNVSVPGNVLRGIAFRGGTYTDTPGIIPLTTAPTTETSTAHSSFNSDGFYPTRLWMANFFDALNGGITRLVLFPAQFKSSAPGATDGILRQFSSVSLQFYYLPDNWASASPELRAAGVSPAPSILGVSGEEDSGNPGQVKFSVNASTDGAAGVQEVWVVYTGKTGAYHGTWAPLDLTQNSNDPTLWEGELTLSGGETAADVQFMVQVVGGAGLTVLDTNSGAYYDVTPIGAPPLVTRALTTLSFVAPPAAGIFGNGAQFTLKLTTPGVPDPTPVVGKVVALNIGGQMALGVTDANGEAAITMSLSVTPGAYTARAGFRGDTDYRGSMDASAFTINKDTTSITTQSSPVAATLKDSSNNGLKGKSLVFIVHDTGNTLTFSRSVTTDYSGNAYLGPVPLPPGDYTVDVYFNGAIPNYTTLSDDYYESSNALDLPLTISGWYDVRPPTITTSAKKANNTAYIAGTWTNQTVTVQYACADNFSGVASCPTAQVFSTTGVYVANGSATDNVGNSASASLGPIKIDKVAPNTALGTTKPVNPTTGKSAVFSFSGADANAGIAGYQCKLDTGLYAACTSPKAYTKLALGKHTFYVRAVDKAGNIDATPTIYTWLIWGERAKNGGFNLYPTTGNVKIPTDWIPSNFVIASGDGKDTTVKYGPTGASVKIIGNGKAKTLTQTLKPLAGASGSALQISYWIKSSAALTTSTDCKAQVLFYNNTTLLTAQTRTVSCGKVTTTFQQKKLAFKTTAAFTGVKIVITYSKASGTVWFDLVSLLK